MATALAIPGTPNVPFPSSTVFPMGPAPRGQSAAVQFPLAMAASDNLADPDGNNNVIAGNFNPKPHRGRYADCFYHQGMPVWIGTNHSIDNGILKQYTDNSVSFGHQVDPIYTLPCLNLMLKDAAGEARDYLRQVAMGNARPVGGTDDFDIGAVNRLSEAGITQMLDQVAGKGLKNTPANHLLNITVQGFLRTHNYLGLVEVPNSDSPPTLGGARQAFALNVSAMGVSPIPTKNVWGDSAEKGAHLYWLYQLWQYGQGESHIAVRPYATREAAVPTVDREYIGWNGGIEYAQMKYVGQVLDNQGRVSESLRLKACGLDDGTDPLMADEAYQRLPNITIGRFPTLRCDEV